MNCFQVFLSNSTCAAKPRCRPPPLKLGPWGLDLWMFPEVWFGLVGGWWLVCGCIGRGVGSSMRYAAVVLGRRRARTGFINPQTWRGLVHLDRWMCDRVAGAGRGGCGAGERAAALIYHVAQNGGRKGGVLV